MESSLTSNLTQGYPVVLHADPEHSGLRTAVTLILLAGMAAGYGIVYQILQRVAGTADYATFLSCIGGVVIALGAAYGAELLMKRSWHSGRTVTLAGDGITTRTETGENQQFFWGENLSLINWFFHLRGYARGGRERRVPDKWVCLACQVQQNENRFIVYTYLPPQKAESWITESPRSLTKFHQIFPVQVYDTSVRSRLGPPTRPEIPAAVLTGKDGRYWLAERRRWTDGFELTPQDFEKFIQVVQAHHYVSK